MDADDPMCIEITCEPVQCTFVDTPCMCVCKMEAIVSHVSSWSAVRVPVMYNVI